MNLKDFLANRETPPELYWSLVIEEGWVQAGIWYINGSSAEVVSVGPGAAWQTEDELIGAADAALSSAVQKLPEDYEEPTKTVFGVTSSWVKNGEIAEEYLAKIKKLCTDLSLTPVGFVVLSEAIAHLYKSDEGSPVSAIILGLGKESLEISVFKLGTLVGNTSVSRSVSLIEDVVEGLTRFEGASPLPSRFIVFNGKGGELEEAKEVLMQASWEDDGKIKFLHTPNAEVLSSDRKVLATSLAGANEIGNVTQISSVQDVPAGPIIGEEVQNITTPEVETTPQDLGFAIGEDVTKPTIDSQPIVPQPIQPMAQPQQTFANNFSPEIKVNDYLQKTKNIFHNFSNSVFANKLFTKNHTPGNKSKTPLVSAAVLLTVVLVLAGLYWWFVPKASVVIYASPKKFDQEVDISFSTKGESDVATGVVPATSLTSTVTGDKTKSTTGTKVVGDKAKGSVQVQNGTAFPISLTAGTFLVSSGNLKFALDNNASVSAALSPTSPGTASLAVTAETIGAEYNLAKDEVFKVGNYPKAEVDGTSTANFSGGSSQEIPAVDKTDQAALESQLTQELKEKAKDELLDKVQDDQILVDDLADTTTASSSYDHKIGEEASNLKLTLTVDATGIAANKAKLLEYARMVLKEKIPSGFVLRDSQINFKFTFVDSADDRANYKVTISANFLPEISTDSLIKQIAGKTTDVAEKYLSAIPGFTRARVTLKPKLPGFFGTLPRVKKNISVEIIAEE